MVSLTLPCPMPIPHRHHWCRRVALGRVTWLGPQSLHALLPPSLHSVWPFCPGLSNVAAGPCLFFGSLPQLHCSDLHAVHATSLHLVWPFCPGLSDVAAGPCIFWRLAPTAPPGFACYACCILALGMAVLPRVE